MSKIKISAFFGVASVLLTSVAFALDYYWFYGGLPGYRVLAYPGIVALRFFSEELDFIHKLSILFFSQFVFYTLVIYIIFMVKRAIKQIYIS
jgi:hypothetical protein